MKVCDGPADLRDVCKLEVEEVMVMDVHGTQAVEVSRL